MFGAMLLALPVHAGAALVVDLHAIGADVALAGLRIFRDHRRQGDEAAAIERPALQDRKIEQREVVVPDDFLARARRNFLGKELAHLGQHGQHLDFVEQALRRLHVHEHLDAIGNFVQRIDIERHAHAVLGAELVDEQLRAGIALDVLEEQRRAARAVNAARSPLGDAVGDLGDLQDGIGFRLDAHQFSGLVERGDPFPQVLIGQVSLVLVIGVRGDYRWGRQVPQVQSVIPTGGGLPVPAGAEGPLHGYKIF